MRVFTAVVVATKGDEFVAVRPAIWVQAKKYGGWELWTLGVRLGRIAKRISAKDVLWVSGIGDAEIVRAVKRRGGRDESRGASVASLRRRGLIPDDRPGKHIRFGYYFRSRRRKGGNKKRDGLQSRKGKKAL